MAGTTPREIDTELAALWSDLYTNRERLARFESTALNCAGADFYYRGRRRVTDMTLEAAEAILAADVAANTDDEYGYTRVRRSTSIGNVRYAVEGLAECRTNRDRLLAEIAVLEARYTGWSRFFVVTSSAGHIHSSMHCSTCRPTTTYGWLPELSGRTEADCVTEFGPALCSICYPTAPVEWTLAEVKKARAAKAAA